MIVEIVNRETAVHISVGNVTESGNTFYRLNILNPIRVILEAVWMYVYGSR